MFFGMEQLLARNSERALFVEAVDHEYFIRKHKLNEKEKHSHVAVRRVCRDTSDNWKKSINSDADKLSAMRREGG